MTHVGGWPLRLTFLMGLCILPKRITIVGNPQQWIRVVDLYGEPECQIKVGGLSGRTDWWIVVISLSCRQWRSTCD